LNSDGSYNQQAMFSFTTQLNQLSMDLLLVMCQILTSTSSSKVIHSIWDMAQVIWQIPLMQYLQAGMNSIPQKQVLHCLCSDDRAADIAKTMGT
jgi:hypothetical protein